MSTIQFKNVVLFVNDIQKSRRFYEELLEQKVELDFGTNISYFGGLSIWQLSEKHMLYKPPVRQQIDIQSHRTEIYFEVEDIKAFCRKAESAKVHFLHRLHMEEWQQKTIRFYDPDKHLIEAGESMKALVTRLHKEGESPEQISENTYLAVDYVKQLLSG